MNCFRSRAFLLLIGALCVVTVLAAPYQPTAAHGSFETPLFRVSWPDRWHEADRTDTNIVLYDGLTSMTFVAIPNQLSPAEGLAELYEEWFKLYPAEEIEKVPSSNYVDDTSARAVYSTLEASETGTFEPYAVYLEIRRLNADFVLWIGGITPWGMFNADNVLFTSALETLEISPFTDGGAGNQSFVSGHWRIAIASASLTPEYQPIGLQPQADSRWLILLADVTNWSDREQTFQLSDVTVTIPAAESTRQPSTLHSQTVGQALGLSDQIVADTTIAPMERIRTAFVFQVPVTSVEFTVELGNQRISLESILQPGFDASHLPPSSAVPDLIEGTVTELRGGARILVTTADNESTEFILLGSVMPTAGDCYFREATAAVVSLSGKIVLIETDPAVLGGGFAYFWIANEDGSYALLNQSLIERGIARNTAMPESAVFNAWFEASADFAKASNSGVWQACA